MGKSAHRQVVNQPGLQPSKVDSPPSNIIDRPLRIAIIGAGNVATHLARAFASLSGSQREVNVVQILSRKPESGRRLADQINGCESISDPCQLRTDCDLYLVAVNDDAVAQVVASTADTQGVWAHTSGSVPMDVFKERKKHYGVFYPLQTFSKDADVDVARMPMFVEGNDPHTTARLESFARMISGNVQIADSKTRGALHVAAVFACNFANLMWLQANELLSMQATDIRIFLPLIEATVAKLYHLSPREAMTGPARRGDLRVIRKHLESLPDNLKEEYRLLSQSILDLYHPDKSILYHPDKSIENEPHTL